MQSPRRFLPSLSLLSAFEAAARLGSITAAAEELSLTQSAVSRQIQALETQLEVELFHRERRAIRLSAGGHAYAREIREALRKISTASLNLRAHPAGGALTLAAPASFAARWLAPRLPRFFAVHPGLRLNLLTRSQVFDFAAESIDAAITLGRPAWPETESTPLFEARVTPLCAPQLRQHYAFDAPADLSNAPLLHLTTRPDAWERWLERNAVEFDTVHGMLFDQFAAMAEAAVAGLGVALLPETLFAKEIRAGLLEPPCNGAMASPEGYCLFWPKERADLAPLTAFRQWALDEIARGEL